MASFNGTSNACPDIFSYARVPASTQSAELSFLCFCSVDNDDGEILKLELEWSWVLELQTGPRARIVF